MKKIYLGIIAVIGIVSINAAEPQKSYVRIAQEKTIKQFNDSLDRFKRCLHGNCTKTEALKAARDVGIAATLVITGMYLAGDVITKVTRKMEDPHKIGYWPHEYSIPGQIGLATGKLLQLPGEQIAQKLIYQINQGDHVRYNNKEWVVTRRSPLQVVIARGPESIQVPVKDVKKINKNNR